ncbi:hypothetical protein [Azospirillum sp. B510]|uniref:hypothetical protein n=1 Tax=Azospirillum sp. (strain B510) TaxID=137722 RepID=UPI0011D0FBE3|nr:hypothetical protein [Azospirillum sp. B510]
MSDVAEAIPTTRVVSKDMVKSAEDMFAQGVTLSDAAVFLYGDYAPNINDLAEVLIAVWADSLGVGTASPNTSKLTNTLYNAGGDASGGNWTRNDCQKAAQKVYGVWHSGLVRKSLSDTGAIPYPSTNVYSSPDIICNGATRATDQQLSTWTSTSGWNTAPWVNPVNGQNYVYVREKNLFPDQLGGSVSLYAYRASIGMSLPSTWQLIRTESGAARAVVQAVAQNAIGINSLDPFLFNPGSSGPEHVCFVALFSTSYFRNPRPSDNNFDAVRWLTWNGSTGWHNADVPSTKALALGLANLNATSEAFRIEAVCNNVPVGTTVRLVSTDAQGGFDSGALRATRPDEVLSLTVTLPGKHDGTVNVTVLTADGKALPKGAEIDLRYHWLVEPDHPEFVEVARHLLLTRSGLEADGRGALYMGNFLLTGGA